MIKLKYLILFFLMIIANKLFSQNNSTISDVKNYKSAKTENNLTILNLQTKDSVNTFIRFYTDLPEYVEEKYRTVHAVNKEINKFSSINLPSKWNSFFKNIKIDVKKDKLGYYFNCKTENIDTIFYFLSNLVQNHKYQKNDIEKAKKLLKHETDSLKPLLNNKIERITRSVVYGKTHSYSYLLNHNEIDKINEEILNDFYNDFYKPQNTYIVVVGGLGIDSIKHHVNLAFETWKDKDLPKSEYQLQKITEPKIVFFDTIPQRQRKLSMIFPFSLRPFAFDAEKAELLNILVQQLLIKKLIAEKALATDIQAGFYNDKVAGNYQMQIWFEKDSINNLIKNIISVINQLKSGNFNKDELEYSKKFIISDFKRKKNDNKTVTSLILKTEINSLSKNYYSDFVKDINGFTVKKIQNLTEKYLSYNTSVFTILGKWYFSLHDIVKLSKIFRTEHYELNGNIKKIIPKGFNGFHIKNDYIAAVGGRKVANKLKDVNIKLSGIYEMNDQKFFIDGRILHKQPNYLFDISMIRPKKDTIFLHKQVFDGQNGFDSTMVEGKYLKGNEYKILKYKAALVPEIFYENWRFSEEIIKVDTFNNEYVYVVRFKNPAEQTIIDYFGVDTALRRKRIIKDNAHLKERTIIYEKYKKYDEKEILYPYLQIINTKNTIIRMIIRSVNSETKIDKNEFDL